MGQESQRSFILRKTPMMTGKAGPKPSMREFCSMLNQDKDFNKTKENEKDKFKDKEKRKFKDATFWRKKHDIVVKGERCPITGLWFWSPIAKCGCYDDGAIFEGEDDYDFDEDYDYDEDEDD